MKVYHSLDEVSPQDEIHHLAIGYFDGLHRGHHQVILGGVQDSERKNLAVLTFEPHPLIILAPDKAPMILTEVKAKESILDSWGVGFLVIHPFSKEFAQTSADDFLEKLKTSFPHLKSISVGETWKFGHKQQGHAADLQKWGILNNIQVRIQARVLDETGELISSSRIRKMIQEGKKEEAFQLLGHSL
jgi:riboflavin kinase/FMN adenylyltransferase